MSRRLVGILLLSVAMVAGACGGKGSSPGTRATTGSSGSSGSAGSSRPSGKATPVRAGDQVHWPAPPSSRVVALATDAGITVGQFETLQHHVHAHLDVFIDGKHTVVPSGIGIAIDEPGVHVFPDPPIGRAYGGISKACANPCISPLHTHTNSGVIHTESPTDVDHTLGQVFAEWGVTLSDTCVGEYCSPATPIALYVDGGRTPLAGARDIKLTAFKEIAIVIGANPPVIPSKGIFNTD